MNKEELIKYYFDKRAKALADRDEAMELKSPFNYVHDYTILIALYGEFILRLKDMK